MRAKRAYEEENAGTAGSGCAELLLAEGALNDELDPPNKLTPCGPLGGRLACPAGSWCGAIAGRMLGERVEARRICGE